VQRITAVNGSAFLSKGSPGNLNACRKSFFGDRRKLSLRGKDGSVMSEQPPLLLIFLIEHVIGFSPHFVTEIGDQTGTSDGIWPNSKLMTRAVSISKALRQVHRAPEGKAPELRIRPRNE
jgi:hypothetical protein